MFNLRVHYWDNTQGDFLCDDIPQGMVRLRSLRGYKKYKFTKLG